jgi:hypothetical protein
VTIRASLEALGLSNALSNSLGDDLSVEINLRTYLLTNNFVLLTRIFYQIIGSARSYVVRSSSEEEEDDQIVEEIDVDDDETYRYD